jgi:hypothetical protein
MSSSQEIIVVLSNELSAFRIDSTKPNIYKK